MAKLSLQTLPRDYKNRGLVEKTLPSNPFQLFQKWFREALKNQTMDVTAFTLATCNNAGKPSMRTILLKGYDTQGFVFYTNYESLKGQEIAKKPIGSMLFYWDALVRQVRIEGKIQKVTARESDDYFALRPRINQISSWASVQSRVIPGRKFFEDRMLKYEKQFSGKPIPRPPHWGGYRLVPNEFEFWFGRANRLHDRLRYKLKAGGKWAIDRLSP
jgi:pyridoxamine 5'-phosphate oxidase